jgi:hypothetical protein
LQAGYEDLIKELRFLGSCSRCGIALQKTKSMHFVPVNKKARWEFPVQKDTEMNLPWNIAVGVICDNCARQNLKPFWAVELRGDSVYNYTMVELEDSFVPDEELKRFVREANGKFSLQNSPAKIRSAIQNFISGKDMPESELSLVRWYVWQKIFNDERLPRDAREKISFLDQRSLADYINIQVREKLGIDPFS